MKGPSLIRTPPHPTSSRSARTRLLDGARPDRVRAGAATESLLAQLARIVPAGGQRWGEQSDAFRLMRYDEKPRQAVLDLRRDGVLQAMRLLVCLEGIQAEHVRQPA